MSLGDFYNKQYLTFPRIPRMSNTDRDLLAFSTADSGYTIINTTTNQLEQWDGTAWVASVDISKIDAILYADTTGSDSNPGTEDEPFLTPDAIFTALTQKVCFRDAVANFAPGTAATQIAAGSDGASLPQATINVATTTDFPTSGVLNVTTANGLQRVTYTGVTATSFTGCSGGTGAMKLGNGCSQLNSYTFSSSNFRLPLAALSGPLAGPLTINGGYTNELGNLVADVSDASGATVGKSTLNLIVDGYIGATVLDVTNGQQRTVVGNTATTFTVNVPFTANTNGHTFRLQWPAVEINFATLNLRGQGGGSFVAMRGIKWRCTSGSGTFASFFRTRIFNEGCVWDMSTSATASFNTFFHSAFCGPFVGAYSASSPNNIFASARQPCGGWIRGNGKVFSITGYSAIPTNVNLATDLVMGRPNETMSLVVTDNSELSPNTLWTFGTSIYITRLSRLMLNPIAASGNAHPMQLQASAGASESVINVETGGRIVALASVILNGTGKSAINIDNPTGVELSSSFFSLAPVMGSGVTDYGINATGGSCVHVDTAPVVTDLTDNPLAAGATTVNVTSTTGFASATSSAPRYIQIEDEIIRYTGTTATSFTGCTRGWARTTDASHVVGSIVGQGVTVRGTLGDMKVGNRITRTWADFTASSPASGAPSQNEFDVPNFPLQGGDTETAGQTTGSRIFV